MQQPYTVEEEIEWEQAMLQWGAELFDARNSKAPFMYSPAGRRFLKTTLKASVDAIVEFRKEVLGGTGRKNPMRFLAMLEPDTIALYVLGTMAGAGVSSTSGVTLAGTPMLTLSRKVSKALEDEINLRHLISASRRAADRWREEKGIEVNIMSLVEKSLKEDGYSQNKMWRLKQLYKDDLESCDMTVEEATRIGSDLIELMVRTFPDYWTRVSKTRPVRGEPKTTNILVLSDELREKLESVNESYRLVQAQTLPMLIPPKQWEMK